MTEQQRRQILVETVKTFARQEWFRDATIYDQHPDTGEPTLEFKVNYLPLFERSEVKEFVLKYGLIERFLKVDRNGNPTE
jgi:hypothetical protein